MDAMLTPVKNGTAIRVKVVPGASRSEIAGALGDRLKVRIAAPPEGGKANKAVCALLAQRLDLPVKALEVTAGHGRPGKTVLVKGIQPETLRQRLSIYLDEVSR